MQPRKICVVTGTRAEYGLLYWFMRDIENDPALTLQLVVTGTHLEPKFGHTVDVIEADGFKIDARVPIELTDDRPTTIARSMGLAIGGIAQALEALKPDIVVILGDRFEILGAAEAAMLTQNLIAHIHGGEATEGLIDEAIRHAISKMSHFHFASAEEYRQRIIQMGEHPDRVFTVGAPGLDNIDCLDLLEKDALAHELNIDSLSEYLLVTYHPVTLKRDNSAANIMPLLAALDAFPEQKIIFTGVNADPGHSAIHQALTHYADKNADRVSVFSSLGQLKYLSALKHCSAVVGNSSSGLIEAPAMGIPTVNIGERQQGRLRASSVIDCADTIDAITSALSNALSNEHRMVSQTTVNPYGTAGASKKIKDYIVRLDLDNVLIKHFFDLPVTI